MKVELSYIDCGRLRKTEVSLRVLVATLSHCRFGKRGLEGQQIITIHRLLPHLPLSWIFRHDISS
jgi:hypothetical protein